jgi:hypothetical protein
MKKRKKVQSLMEALALIEGNCGPQARQLLSGHPALMPKAIMELAGTSPEYQQHVLDRIRAGHARPLNKTAASVLVYETVGFYEVPSRMHRALGNVRHEAAYVTKHVSADTPVLDRGADRLLTLALVIETATEIVGHFGRLQVTGYAHFSPNGKTPALPDKLHAAGALGLLAKNARDLPHLKPEHHPTAEEQRKALSLCEQIVAVAQPALRSARKKWGNLDAQLRVRPAGKVARRIITHADPDGDALVAAWLAERYLFAGEAVEILFVPRSRVLGCLRIGDCLVDVGNTFDPARHLYDHKPPALPSRHDSCAAKLVWEHLLNNGKPVKHLEDLVLAVFAWDSVKRRHEFAAQATASKRNGFHAALDAAKQKGLNNATLYRHLRRWLNNAYPDRE